MVVFVAKSSIVSGPTSAGAINNAISALIAQLSGSIVAVTVTPTAVQYQYEINVVGT